MGDAQSGTEHVAQGYPGTCSSVMFSLAQPFNCRSGFTVACLLFRRLCPIDTCSDLLSVPYTLVRESDPVAWASLAKEVSGIALERMPGVTCHSESAGKRCRTGTTSAKAREGAVRHCSCQLMHAPDATGSKRLMPWGNPYLHHRPS